LGKNFLTTGYDATVFTTITVKKDTISSQLSTSYDDVRAADHFTETVQGWFKNPHFLQSIRESELNRDILIIMAEDFTISAERQEKQNLVINFHVDGQDRVDNISNAAISVLENAIQKYNRTSDTDFAIASHETYYAKSASKLNFLLLFALILGLCAGIGLSYIYEYLTGKILSPLHAENMLNKKAADIILHFNYTHTYKYLNTLLDNSHSKKYLLIFTWDVNTKHQNKTIDRFNKKDIHAVNFIKTPEKITSESNRLPILFVKPGKTGYRALFRVKALLPENYLLVIQE